LLERLRTTVAADGAAFVQPGRVDAAIVTAGGLQPAPGPFRSDRRQLSVGRVAVVHNDPARVEQVSGVRWPPSVTSLLVVPVIRNGQAWSTIEIANERPRQVSDWDAALARVVADRLAAVAAQERGRAARAS
jgi:GAF domain-containing protein